MIPGLTGTAAAVLDNGPPPRGADCTMLCHFDGADGSTTFTDELGTVWVAGGNARIRTAKSKFGGSALYLDGSGDYMIPNTSPAGLAFGTGDWTVDLWFNGDPGFDGGIFDARSGSSTSGRLLIYVGAGGINGGPPISAGVWHHYAVTRASGVRRSFIDGVQQGANTADGTNYNLGFSRPAIGADGNGLGTAFFAGYIDEYRCRKGTAEWTTNFIPPSYAYL